MHVAQAQVLAALVGSIVLLLQSSARLFPILALAASGIETLLVFRVVNIAIHGINLGFLLGVTLLVAGGVSWWQQSGKATVTAATVVTLVGAIQVLSRWA